MGKREDRHDRLMRILKTHGKQSVRKLAEMLSVSEMTVRRDLYELGNSYNHTLNTAFAEDTGGYDLLTALQKSYEQKNEIGRVASSLIKPDDIIIIDTGSTTAQMLKFLPENYNLTVMCYNTNVLMDLRYKTGITPLFCGGVYHRDTEMFESPEGLQFISRIRANKAFLSAAGIHKDLGITCINGYEVPTKQMVISSSLERILVADSGKFGRVQASFFCKFSDITAVITDNKLSVEWQDYIQERDMALYMV